MNRNFAILGLREDATKEQVKQAYELRLKKYRASDYDDDPDYVRKKIAELKDAYESACGEAGAESIYDSESRDDFDRESQYEPENYEPETYKPREYKPEKYDHDRFERDRDRAAERGEEHRFRLPDISKLKDKMDSLKDTVSENVGGFAEDIQRGVQDNSADEPPAHVRRLDGNGNVIEPVPQPVNTPRLDGSGSGSVMETPRGADAGIYNDSESHPPVSGKFVAGIVVAVLVIAVMFVSSMCDNGNDDYDAYDDSSYSDDSAYMIEYTTIEDQRIHNTAIESNNFLWEQEYAGSWEVNPSSDEEIHKQADRFAKKYFEMDSIEEVTQYLYDAYGEFVIESSEPVNVQLEEILAFYEFDSFFNQEGRINPYTKDPITSMAQYLQYLNAYFDRNGIDDGTE